MIINKIFSKERPNNCEFSFLKNIEKKLPKQIANYTRANIVTNANLLSIFLEKSQNINVKHLNNILDFTVKIKKIKLNQAKAQHLPFFCRLENQELIIVLSIYHDKAKILNFKSNQIEEIELTPKTEGSMFLITQKKREELISYRDHLIKFLSIFWINTIQLTILLIIFGLTYSKGYIYLTSFNLSSIALVCAAILLIMSIGNIIKKNISANLAVAFCNNFNKLVCKNTLYLPNNYTKSRSIDSQAQEIKKVKDLFAFFEKEKIYSILSSHFIIINTLAAYYYVGLAAIIPAVVQLSYGTSSLIIKWGASKLQKVYYYHQHRKDKLLLETVAYMYDLKSLACEQHWLNRFNQYSYAANKYLFLNSCIQSIIYNINHYIIHATNLAMILYYLPLIAQEQYSVFDVSLVVALGWGTQVLIKRLFNSLPDIFTTHKQISIVNQLASHYIYNDNAKKVKYISNNYGRIIFKKVFFKYNINEPCLNNLSFEIKPGALTCIAGRQFSGKSTILKLIIGLYPPAQGKVAVNGLLSQTTNTKKISQNIAYIPKEPKIFEGTIAQNILLSRPGASDVEMEISTRLAGLYEDIMKLTHGFDTIIDNYNKVNFSYSFLHRISIARAIIRNSAIILIDFSNIELDKASNSIFMDFIKYNKGKKTIIITTNDLKHIQLSEQLIYLHDGSIAYDGKPDTVLAKIPPELF